MDLEVRRNETFQRREWRVERIGWVLLCVLVLAGLAGFLGPGPFASRTVTSERDLVTVEYDRIGHYEADDSVTFTFSRDAAEEGSVTFRLTGAWTTAVDLQSIVPEPSDQTAVPDGVVLAVPVDGAGPIRVAISFRAQALGNLPARVSVRDDAATFDQFVLP